MKAKYVNIKSFMKALTKSSKAPFSTVEEFSKLLPLCSERLLNNLFEESMIPLDCLVNECDVNKTLIIIGNELVKR